VEIDFDYKDTTYEIKEQIARIPESLNGSKKTIIKKMAKTVQKNLIGYFKEYESDIPNTASNYDGSTPYVHLANDVKVNTKDDNQGFVYAIVRGGKYTGYKWHMIENGTTHSKALHLIDKAMSQSEDELDTIIDEAIGRAVQGGN